MYRRNVIMCLRYDDRLRRYRSFFNHVPVDEHTEVVFVRNSRAAGLALLVIGIGLMALAMLADTLGFGGGRGFGYQQLIVFIAGMVAVLFAGAILLQPRHYNGNGSGYTQDHDSDTGT